MYLRRRQSLRGPLRLPETVNSEILKSFIILPWSASLLGYFVKVRRTFGVRVFKGGEGTVINVFLYAVPRADILCQPALHVVCVACMCLISFSISGLPLPPSSPPVLQKKQNRPLTHNLPVRNDRKHKKHSPVNLPPLPLPSNPNQLQNRLQLYLHVLLHPRIIILHVLYIP